MCYDDLGNIASELDNLKYTVEDLETAVYNIQELVGDACWFFLVGIKGTRRHHIAIFDDAFKLREFLFSCQLAKQPNLHTIAYKKKSPVYGFDKLIVERSYAPPDIPYNPTIEDFR